MDIAELAKTGREPLSFSGRHSVETLCRYRDSGLILRPIRCSDFSPLSFTKASPLSNLARHTIHDTKSQPNSIASLATGGVAKARATDNFAKRDSQKPTLEPVQRQTITAVDKLQNAARERRLDETARHEKALRLQQQLIDAQERRWYERPLGLSIIGATTAILGGVIGAVVSYYLPH